MDAGYSCLSRSTTGKARSSGYCSCMTTHPTSESPVTPSTLTQPAASMSVIPVPIDRIEIVPDRDHRGEDVDLDDLVQSMRAIGLLHPLLVLPPTDGGTYELLAGHRRLRAARQLGCTEARVQVITLDELRTELATIHDNLARKNLPPTEEGRQLARAKAIYEELHPATRHGGKRQKGSSGHSGNLKKAKGFVKATAEATGRSARASSRAIKVVEAGATVLQAAVDAGKVKIAQAERIAGLPPEQQGAEVAKVIAQNAQTNSNEKPLKISEPERVLELVQRVRDILSQVTMAVREKCPLKSATSA